MDPWRAQDEPVARSCPRCSSTSSHSSPKGRRAHLRTQRHRPRHCYVFSLQNGTFCGCRDGGHGHRSWTPSAAGGCVCARAGRGGHAPVVAVLRASGKSHRAHVRTQKGFEGYGRAGPGQSVWRDEAFSRRRYTRWAWARAQWLEQYLTPRIRCCPCSARPRWRTNGRRQLSFAHTLTWAASTK